MALTHVHLKNNYGLTPLAEAVKYPKRRTHRLQVRDTRDTRATRKSHEQGARASHMRKQRTGVANKPSANAHYTHAHTA